jgi:hypothetical protein
MPCPPAVHCCIEAPQLPPAVVTPAFAAQSTAAAEAVSLPAFVTVSTQFSVAVSTTAPQSPPPGAFSLRI